MLVEHTLHVQPEGYQEPYNEGLKAHPGLAHAWDLNWEPFKSVCYVLSQSQPNHVKNKELIVVCLAWT